MRVTDLVADYWSKIQNVKIFSPKRFDRLPSVVDENAGMNFVGEGCEILKSVDTGTIRLFSGWYMDNTISCNGVDLVVVNEDTPEYNYYYAIVAISAGGEIRIGDKCLSKAGLYHFISTGEGLKAVRIEKYFAKSSLEMDDRRNFKPISEL
ncbi:hypothetical protein [Shimazuella alba]|uniref:Uncharacterized protein n=1 Tax=Shimazuella alba TaxID=2690964 RepID=A0A6I4VRU1_9BACL|nr:hypothetical protein [Shimazuella alba]MXQ53733.1 hypothetical protein [Shimazuella alba]